MNMFTVSHWLFALAFVSSIALYSDNIDYIITPKPISGKNLKDLDNILPADVLSHVNLLRRELELIGKEMGKLKDQREEIAIENASPREVFFQALTLFQKANRFSFEQTRTKGISLAIPKGEIRPVHVWRVVDTALKRILLVKKKLGIPEVLAEIAVDDSTSPTDVFKSIIQGNRQLNIMLKERFSPNDVFQEVTLAIHYTERLLKHFPNVISLPQAPPYKRRKTPANVIPKAC